MSEDEIEYYAECLNEAVEIVKLYKCKGTSVGIDQIIAAIVFLKMADAKRQI